MKLDSDFWAHWLILSSSSARCAALSLTARRDFLRFST
jgi:hypothetical protein